jgi:hypothetical protein
MSCSSGASSPSSPLTTATGPRTSSGQPSAPASPGWPVWTDQSACRVPIAPYGAIGSAGFVSYPLGVFTPDDTTRNFQSPPGLAPYPLSYDATYSKWLPVPYQAVSPDGRRYAYATSTNAPPGVVPAPYPGLHVVDLVTGSNTIVATGEWAVVTFAAKGIYATGLPQMGPPSGLWLIDPDTEHIQQIADAGWWLHVSDGFAWGSGAQSTRPDFQAGDLLKLDLATGQIDPRWFVNLSVTIYPLGDDGRGHVIVQGTNDVYNEIWLVDEKTGDHKQIASGTSQGLQSLNSTYAQSDSHGVWFGTQGGIYVYTGGWQLKLVSAQAGQIAGPCL